MPGSLAAAEKEGITVLSFRNQRALLDQDLALLFGVEVKALNQTVKRHRHRFPGDFMYQLTADEYRHLRSLNVTINEGRGKHRKYLPYAFTGQGIAMLSGLLNSERAFRVNIEIMRAFVNMRKLLAPHQRLVRKVESLEQRHDSHFRAVFTALKHLIAAPAQGRPEAARMRSSNKHHI